MAIEEKLESGRVAAPAISPNACPMGEFVDGMMLRRTPLDLKQYYLDIDAVLEQASALN